MNGRDRIIDRYINGQMSPSEQIELQHMMEKDPELRQTIEAEQALTRIMLKDRAHLSGMDHSATYASFLAGLASQVPVSEPVSHAPAPQPPAHVPASGVWSGGILGKVIISATTAAAVVTIGILSFQNRNVSRPASAAETRPVPTTVSTAPAPGTAMAAPSSQNPIAPSASAASPAPTATRLAPTEESLPATEPSDIPAGTVRRLDESHAAGHRSAAATPRTEIDEWHSGASDDQDLPVYRSDSIKMNMRATPRR